MIVSLGTIVSSYFSGWILKKFGTAFVTFVSVLMTAVALLGFALVPSFFFLILLAIPLGLGAGCVDSGLNTYIAAHYKSHHMSWLHCFWGVGAMTGPFLTCFFPILCH
jgi:MFS family permease